MIFIANFKAYKTDSDVYKWLEKFHILQKTIEVKKDTLLIIAPQFTALEHTKEFINNNKWVYKTEVSSQDVSQYEKGSYTGEVTALMIKEVCTYVIIGHSERRKYFSENPQVVNNKIQVAVENNIKPVVCISSVEELQKIDERFLDRVLIAYEPISAIGSGNALDALSAGKIVEEIKKVEPSLKIFYGGSVTSQNVLSYVSMGGFDGVLVGKVSLDPYSFINLIYNGAKI